ncbi:LuxR C-terminal-related transcriptional regulator [Streptomyces sp. NPDC058985]|uniref:LuxR C-terminal-related transcriptional regulator n=1 Tax=Streptomyces sp. NPDC058985 TaxID=3346684 RepID=UPI0036AF5618
MTAPVRPGPPPSGSGPGPVLTDRELELLRRQAAGETYRDIAPTLFMSVSGVGSMSKRMIDRMGARNLAHAIHLAHQHRLLDPPATVKLSPPLLRVLELVADGWTNAEIARRLNLSEHTVKDHVKKIRRLLGARDRAHAAVLAVEARIIRRPEIRTS